MITRQESQDGVSDTLSRLPDISGVGRGLTSPSRLEGLCPHGRLPLRASTRNSQIKSLAVIYVIGKQHIPRVEIDHEKRVRERDRESHESETEGATRTPTTRPRKQPRQLHQHRHNTATVDCTLPDRFSIYRYLRATGELRTVFVMLWLSSIKVTSFLNQEELPVTNKLLYKY